jgi:hypothetical protein
MAGQVFSNEPDEFIGRALPTRKVWPSSELRSIGTCGMKYLKCACQHCRENIEYPADAAGLTVECPHCHEQTDLTVEVPGGGTEGPRHGWLLWAIVALLVLGLLGALAPALLKRLAPKVRNTAASATSAAAPRPVSKPAANVITNDFRVSPVTIERVTNSSLVYATGTVLNQLGKQRFAVRVEIELLDSAGNAVGTTSDYAAMMEAKAEWRFKAIVLKKNAAKGRVTEIREQYQ